MTMGGEPKRPEMRSTANAEDVKAPATYEQLLSQWATTKDGLDASQVKEYGTLAFCLNNVYVSFSKPPFACDSGVKNIFENQNLKEELKQKGITEEFLLHTVRIGAIKEIQNRLEQSPGIPVELYSDGTMFRLVSDQVEGGRLEDSVAERQRLIRIIRQIESVPTIDGYSWANQQLRDKAKEKETAQKDKRDADLLRIEGEKLTAINRIKTQMHEPDFHLSTADATLLREEFESKLRLWKGILEGGVGEEMQNFLQEYGDNELTPEVFAKFKAFYETNSAIQKKISSRSYSLPLEIIDPNSGWFAVLVINKQKTLRQFFGSAYSNMNRWFNL